MRKLKLVELDGKTYEMTKSRGVITLTPVSVSIQKGMAAEILKQISNEELIEEFMRRGNS